jgi:monoamine oxidase
MSKQPGDLFYYVSGQHYTEAEVIDELRVLQGRMHDDLATISSAPSFYLHTPADVAFDQLSLAAYLDARAGDLPLVHAILEAAYIGEYGRELADQSALNFLLYIRNDRRAKFEPFGSSDERYHLVNGNDQIAAGIRDRLPGPLLLGAELEGLRRTRAGRYALKFKGASTEELADAVVLAIPFSVLRNVTLDPSLGLSTDKLRAIDELGYGWNAKMMVGFSSRPWDTTYGSTGAVYADLAALRNTWETNYTQAAGGHAILTNYAGGDYAASLQNGPQNPKADQQRVAAFLDDLDLVYPGAAATVQGGKYVVQKASWLTNPLSRGSYTCYLPGQFTSICELESESAAFLHFAGEQSDSFYNAQGFMEGALYAGQAAASKILQQIKDGLL